MFYCNEKIAFKFFAWNAGAPALGGGAGRAYFNVPTGTDVLKDLKSVLEGLVTRA